MQSAELSPRTFAQYRETADELIAHFGKQRLVSDLGPDDFATLRNKLAKRWKPLTVGNFIQRARVVFKYAADNGLIDRPVRYGQGFKRPSKRTLRLEKVRQGVKLFTREEILRLLGAASVPMKAMILLGVNCGLGNADCGRLPRAALDLEQGWLDFPRGKTGMARRCPLWPETVQALREALAKRPEPKDQQHAGLVFITRFGQSWHNDSTENPVAYEFGKLLRKLGINGRKGLGFYTLGHTFRTIGDEAKHQIACDYCMGHEVLPMSSVYRETISDARLRAVTDHLRRWLFSSAKPAPAAKPQERSGEEE
jgi:integrase